MHKMAIVKPFLPFLKTGNKQKKKATHKTNNELQLQTAIRYRSMAMVAVHLTSLIIFTIKKFSSFSAISQPTFCTGLLADFFKKNT